jgi:hypothetical protein
MMFSNAELSNMTDKDLYEYIIAITKNETPLFFQQLREIRRYFNERGLAVLYELAAHSEFYSELGVVNFDESDRWIKPDDNTLRTIRSIEEG